MTENEMTSLLLKLADIGITGLKVTYDGGGDSGSVESIGYTAKPCETPEDVNDEIDSYTPDFSLSELDSSLHSQIDDLAYKMLDDIEDWWNNEGGWGELCICVPSGKYIINNHIRITETEDFFHDGSLFDKIED